MSNKIQIAGSLVNENAKKQPLADVFAGNDGGAYYVSESGDQVHWFAEHPGRDYAHVFHGKREGAIIKGRFMSVPKDETTTHGEVTLEVQPNGSLKRLDQSGGFPSKSLSVVSMDAIVDKLPSRRARPGFTSNTDDDLDGVFDSAEGYRCYVRQIGSSVVFFAESDFEKGDRPEGALVFTGERAGNTVKGTWVAVPKGKKAGAGSLTLSLGKGRTLIQAGSSPLGNGSLSALLEPIRIPIATVMDVMNSLLNKVQIRLDGYSDSGGDKKVEGKSYIKIGSVETPLPSDDLRFDGLINRYILDNMESEVIHAKPISDNETRLSVFFEDHGTEIKRVRKRTGWDTPKDWDIEAPRVDIYFKLVNRKTTSGADSISYQVTKVQFLGEFDAPLLIEGIDEWLTGKARPTLEARILKTLNDDVYIYQIADLVKERLDQLVKKTSEYPLFGYLLAQLLPKRVGIEGKHVVFYFI